MASSAPGAERPRTQEPRPSTRPSLASLLAVLRAGTTLNGHTVYFIGVGHRAPGGSGGVFSWLGVSGCMCTGTGNTPEPPGPRVNDTASRLASELRQICLPAHNYTQSPSPHAAPPRRTDRLLNQLFIHPPSRVGHGAGLRVVTRTFRSDRQRGASRQRSSIYQSERRHVRYKFLAASFGVGACVTLMVFMASILT